MPLSSDHLVAAVTATVGCCLALLADCAMADTQELWVRNGRPTPQALEISAVLKQADEHGLDPEDYSGALSPAQLQQLMNGADAALLARFDQQLTRSVSRFVADLQRGRVDPETVGYHLPRNKQQLADVSTQLANSADVKALLASLEPSPRPYRMLREALATYRALARDLAVQSLPPLPSRSLEVGDEYAGTTSLRRFLVALGDMPADSPTEITSATRIDTALSDGVRRFQERHGLNSDGVIGRQTFAALNVPLHRRVRQIELALERWRWLASLERPDIIVNIPQFMLYALPRPGRADERLLEMPVIVGRSRDKTPVFVAAIEQVIFQPYWDVPASIMRNELLPKIRKDPTYIERHHFEIVRGGGDDAKVLRPTPAVIEALAAGELRIRQRPGPDNALGPVKFVLPNPYQVRLHGTAEPRLFEDSRRAFSHGCIRVSDPAALAEYVLVNASGDWNAAAVEAAMCGTKTLRVSLHKPVKVVIFYATAAATQSKGVLFSEDIYDHDAKLERQLSLRH